MTLAAFVFLLTSCKKDDTLYYGNVTMGNFVGEKFISDQGNEFTIAENLTGEKFDGITRAIMQCDILNKIKGAADAYEVRVQAVAQVLAKIPIETEAAAADPEKVVEDPIMINEVWISGGFLNMYVLFEVKLNPIKKNSKHMVNLVFSESDQGTGSYTLTLRHNSFGETLGGSSDDTQSASLIQWGLSGAYVSFQLSELIQEQTAEITLNWNEHLTVNNEWMSDSVIKTKKLTYDKNSFEHQSICQNP